MKVEIFTEIPREGYTGQGDDPMRINERKILYS
jgi:hypothetical protein